MYENNAGLETPHARSKRGSAVLAEKYALRRRGDGREREMQGNIRYLFGLSSQRGCVNVSTQQEQEIRAVNSGASMGERQGRKFLVAV